MSPTSASGPTLSRFWVAVWATWPALHAVSATGLRSRTPTVAARSARFTAVDLQGRAGHRRSMARVAPSLTPTPGWPPGGEAVPQDPVVGRTVTGMPRRPAGDPALAAFPARAPGTRRWCFADQLGPHFLDRPDQPVLLIESKAVFARRRFHRQKAHLVLSALRHRAAELGDQAEFSQVHTYAEALDRVREPLSVCAPTTWSSRDYVLRRPDLSVLAADRWMTHSLLSPAVNLGLLDPIEEVHAAEQRYRDSVAEGDPLPLNSVEGFVRQVMGWRDYIWHTYWHFGRDFRHANALAAHEPVPEWLADLDDGAVDAACLSDVLGDLRRDGWVHHIPRLMVLGNYALQRGIDPLAMTDWFHRTFVDGYDWVMVANVVGMSQHADGGLLATKPYAAGGAYIDRMSDYCGGCRYDPRKRLGEDACPFTAGYWAFLERNRERLGPNQRMRRALQGLDRLKGLDEVVEQERLRGTEAI